MTPLPLQHLERYAVDAVLKDGQTVHLRPIRPDDLDAMLEFWRRLSPETIRLRFFAPRTMDAVQMRYFTDVDYQRRVAIVAEHAGSIVGVARFDRYDEDPSTAEFAVTVADAHQGRGIGTGLLRALLAPARDLGVVRLHGDILSENRSMLAVVRDAGFEPVMRSLGSVVEAEFTTTPTEAFLRAADEQDRRAAVAALRSVLAPSSIAVVGASRDPRTIGGLVLHHLVQGRFEGPVYPVNSAASHVQSIAAYPSVSACPTVPDLLVVSVPAPAVADVVEEAARIGTRAAVILSAGFADAGAEGLERERRLMEVVRAYGIRVVGPNCMGVLNAAPDVRLNATFSSVFPRPGRVAFSSQSGALGLAILASAERLGLGVSSFASIGNKADLSGNDLLQYWEADPGTDVVLLYLESFGNPRKFGRIARRVGRSKPVVAVKAGRSVAGQRAASSHTGALASGDVAVEALFRQAGVIRTETLEDLFNVAAVLANQPLPRGDRVAILTNGGGPGMLAADACEAEGLAVPELAPETVALLRGFLPAEAGVRNPVDMVASASASAYGRAVQALAQDPDVDALLVIFVPPVVTDADEVARELVAAARAVAEPVVSVFMAEQGLPAELAAAGIPSFRFPEAAARALGQVARYARWRRRPLGNVVEVEDADVDGARAVVAEALDGGRADAWLTPAQAERLLTAFGIATAATRPAVSAEEAAAATAAFDGPVVVKSAAPVHKTDLGLVRLGIVTPEDAADAVRAMERSLHEAGLDELLRAGWIVQEVVPEGVEVVVGVQHDPTFGPILLVGLGGVLVELLGDVSVRIHPLTDIDVDEMLAGLRGYPLLTGYRGAEPADVDALKRLLLRLSALVEEVPEVDELDLNPVFVRREGLAAVDARIRLVRRTGAPRR